MSALRDLRHGLTFFPDPFVIACHVTMKRYKFWKDGRTEIEDLPPLEVSKFPERIYQARVSEYCENGGGI